MVLQGFNKLLMDPKIVCGGEGVLEWQFENEG